MFSKDYTKKSGIILCTSLYVHFESQSNNILSRRWLSTKVCVSGELPLSHLFSVKESISDPSVQLRIEAIFLSLEWKRNKQMSTTGKMPEQKIACLF